MSVERLSLSKTAHLPAQLDDRSSSSQHHHISLLALFRSIHQFFIIDGFFHISKVCHQRPSLIIIRFFTLFINKAYVSFARLHVSSKWTSSGTETVPKRLDLSESFIYFLWLRTFIRSLWSSFRYQSEKANVDIFKKNGSQVHHLAYFYEQYSLLQNYVKYRIYIFKRLHVLTVCMIHTYLVYPMPFFRKISALV